MAYLRHIVWGWIYLYLKPKTFPLLNPASKCSPSVVSQWANLFNMCPFPDSPALYLQNVFPIGPAVWPHFPGFLIVDPLKPPKIPPWGIVGRIVFLAYVHSQMNPQTCTNFGANRSIRLEAFPYLNLWPPITHRNAPCGIEGRIVFSYVHSQTNPQTCTKFGANRSSSFTASPDIWICDPLNPLRPPGVSWTTCI